MRFDDFDQVIGEHFEHNVGNKEHGQCCCKLVTVQTKRFFDSIHLCIGDVHSIEEGKEVEQTERWNDTQVDLPHQSALVDVALRGELIHLGLFFFFAQCQVGAFLCRLDAQFCVLLRGVFFVAVIVTFFV